MAQVTRLGLYGGPRPVYGLFDGKTPNVAVIDLFKAQALSLDTKKQALSLDTEKQAKYFN